jgi:hypothetical protein
MLNADMLMSGEVADDMPKKPAAPSDTKPSSRPTKGQLVFLALLLICGAAVGVWVVFLGWSAGYIFGAW